MDIQKTPVIPVVILEINPTLLKRKIVELPWDGGWISHGEWKGQKVRYTGKEAIFTRSEPRRPRQ